MSAPRGFHTITLGCKLNQFDTAAIEGELTRRGLRPQEDLARAAVVVVNTCTVTAKADIEARKLIRRVHRSNPDCRLLVTGCYAELEPDRIRSLEGVDRVVGNRDKAEVARVFDELGIGEPPREAVDPGVPGGGDRGCEATLTMPRALHFGDRSRAFLRVQEGCRLACSYCVIPRVRGASRSVAPSDIEAAASRLFHSGYREVVLTGVNTGDFGRDLSPPTDLATLLRRLLARAGANRIRLNSLEPLTVSDEIIALMAADPRLVPHLQVPLQSGSDSVLRRMRRNYRSATYRERVEHLAARVPDIGLGADVIVGFPGESDDQFQETFDFIDRSPLSYLHVFSWSPRPGTPASELPERVPAAEIRSRSARLRSLARDKSRMFRRRFVGRHLDAVVLAPRKHDGKLRALTGNFIEVALDADAAARGALVRVEVLDARDEETLARVDGIPSWAIPRAPAPRESSGRDAVLE